METKYLESKVIGVTTDGHTIFGITELEKHEDTDFINSHTLKEYEEHVKNT